MHDGAVIIRNNRIAVAAAYLPLSDNSMIPKKLGTRHRAAVGISEVTDAITIVVSEETGGVTITRNSQFMLDLTREEYLKYLNAQLVPKEEEEKPKWYQRIVNHVWNWGSNKNEKVFDKPWFYRIIALILAILLAVYVASNQQGYVTQGRREETLKTATKTQVIKVPLQVSVNTDKYYVTGYPEKVNLTFRGIECFSYIYY